MEALLKSKTFWTGVGAVLAGAGGFATGTMSSWEAGMMVYGGLQAIFLRDAIAKK